MSTLEDETEDIMEEFIVPRKYSSVLSALAQEMYGQPKQLKVRTWDECNTWRYMDICGYQEGYLDSNDLMRLLLNQEYLIEQNNDLATSFIETIAYKLGNAYRNHSILKQETPGQDELQDVILRIFVQLKTDKPLEETATAWVFKIVDGNISKHMRDRTRAYRRGLGEDTLELVSLDDLDDNDLFNNPTETPEESYKTSDMLKCLTSLSPRQQEIMEMLIDGLSYKEIAESLDISENTVNRHIQEARANLAQFRANY